MVTLTTRHYRGDALAKNLDLALEGWRKMIAGRPWRRTVERLGLAGYVRATEVTYGVNGWHPHIHALLLVDGRLTESQLQTLEREMFALWESTIVDLGGRRLSKIHGVKVSRATSAEYVAKVQEHDRAGVEIARLDLKSGRGGSVMPFELLDRPENRSLWLEYVDATWRRRAITWSKGLKVLLSIADATDEEVMEDVESSDLVRLLDGAEYDAMRNDPGRLVGVLEQAEEGR